MIPRPYIAKWKDVAPWHLDAQIEQDLIISRALVEIFSDDFLSENLAFRGGTALHKLYLKPASRYSEDIDLVQIKSGPIKPILQRLGEKITFFEEPRVVKSSVNNNTILYRFSTEATSVRRARLKIEINCREHFNLMGMHSIPFKIENEWFSGKCRITTYHIEELLGTKLRALYQRKKGRDLFDLYYADQHSKLDYEKIIYSWKEYMKFVVKKLPTKKEFILNINEKKKSSIFSGDMEGLLRPEIHYNQEEAFEWITENLIQKI